jgi:hypothetical protein
MLPGLTAMMVPPLLTLQPEISLVGSVKTSNASGGALTLALPTLQQNDVVYAFCTRPTAATAITITTGGYAILANIIGAGDGACRLAAYRKVMLSGSPDTTVAFNGGDFADGGNVAFAICLRGVKLDTPEDAAAVTTSGNNLPNGPVPTPAITTVTARAWVLAVHGITKNTVPSSVPSDGYTIQATQASGRGDFAVFGVGSSKVVAAAATENPGDWTYNEQGGFAAATIAVRRAGA